MASGKKNAHTPSTMPHSTSPVHRSRQHELMRSCRSSFCLYSSSSVSLALAAAFALRVDPYPPARLVRLLLLRDEGREPEPDSLRRLGRRSESRRRPSMPD